MSSLPEINIDTHEDSNKLKTNDNSQCLPQLDESENQNTSEGEFKKPSFIDLKRKKLIGKRQCYITSDPKKLEKNEEVPPAEDDSSTQTEDVKAKEPLPYTEPIWKGTANENYTLEEMKSGVVENIIPLENKSFVSIGRQGYCDIVMAHPSVSRFHAVLQYRGVPDGEEEKGFYLYDIGSQHGTFLNKAKIKPKMYVRVRVGHMIKFGFSTRFFLLQGPESDQEEESDMTFTEMKQKRLEEKLNRLRKREEELRLEEEEEERQKKLIEERGVSWGIDEDADEEEDLSENPYAVTTNEELYIDDPKKALRQWFEREGEEMQLETEQVEKSMIACKIVLPLDDERGKDIIIESSARSKKEAQTQCCLEACRIIDRMGLFRQAKQEAKRRQTRNWEENDYYDSDEDSFLDRTGDLDLKRQKRMQKVGKIQETIETYESLMIKHSAVLRELEEAESKLEKLLSAEKSTLESGNEDDDALDAFMNNLKHDKPGKLDIKIAKDEVAKVKKEEDRLRALINIAKPTSMPELKPASIPLRSRIEFNNKRKKDKVLETKVTPNTPPRNSGTTEIAEEPQIKKNKVVGPTLPSNSVVAEEEKPKIILLNPQDKVRKRNEKKKLKPKEDDSTKSEEDFTNLIWQPPKGQTGDGRTSLNDKFGY